MIRLALLPLFVGICFCRVGKDKSVREAERRVTDEKTGSPPQAEEKHNTKRHLNEYTSLDLEMGYIDGFEDIMAMETGFLQYMVDLLKKDYEKELKILDVTLPNVDKIPTVRFDEAKRKVAEKYGRKIRNPYDLEPEEEA